MNPSDIIDYNLLEYVRPEKIDLGGYEEAPRFGVIFPSGLIMINKNDPLDEQIRTILHEIIHMHPSFIAYTGGLWERTITRDEQIESEIEKLAQDTFSTRPDIVDFIKRKLEEAYMNSVNLKG